MMISALVPALVSLAVAGVAAVIDWRRGEIPNWLTLPALAAAPFYFVLAAGVDGGLSSISGAIGCGLLPYLMFRMRALGGGDVKLFAALGAWNGFSLGTEVLIVSLLVGCAQAVVILIHRRQFVRVLRRSFRMLGRVFSPHADGPTSSDETMTEMRLGPAILAATCIVFLTGWS